MPRLIFTENDNNKIILSSATILVGSLRFNKKIVKFLLFHSFFLTETLLICIHNIWAAPCKNVFLGICGQKDISDCASAQFVQGLHCPLTDLARIIGYYRMYEWRAKAWLILPTCTG